MDCIQPLQPGPQTGTAPNLCPWACAPRAAAACLAGRCQEDGFIVQIKCFYYLISTNVYGDPLWLLVSLPTLVSVFTQFLVFLLK